MLSCWWHPPFLPPAFQVWVHYHLFNWVIIIELTITRCHPKAFLISPFFFLICIYSYILREESLSFLSFVTPFPIIPGSPKSLDVWGARNDPASPEPKKHLGHPGTHRSSKKEGWEGSNWTIFNKSSGGCSAYHQDQLRISYSSFQPGCV